MLLYIKLYVCLARRQQEMKLQGSATSPAWHSRHIVDLVASTTKRLLPIGGTNIVKVQLLKSVLGCTAIVFSIIITFTSLVLSTT